MTRITLSKLFVCEIDLKKIISQLEIAAYSAHSSKDTVEDTAVILTCFWKKN